MPLCFSIEEKELYLDKVRDISRMLHGKLTMREIITKQDSFWEVISGDSIEEDIVFSKKMAAIAENELPYEDSYFCIATSDMQEYLNKVDMKLYVGIYSKPKQMKCIK